MSILEIIVSALLILGVFFLFAGVVGVIRIHFVDYKVQLI